MIKQHEMNKITDYIAGGCTNNFELVIEAGNHIEIISVLDDAKNVKEYEFTVSNSKYPSIVVTDTVTVPDYGFQDSVELVKVTNELLEQAEELLS